MIAGALHTDAEITGAKRADRTRDTQLGKLPATSWILMDLQWLVGFAFRDTYCMPQAHGIELIKTSLDRCRGLSSSLAGRSKSARA